jgi:hypothetical protein
MSLALPLAARSESGQTSDARLSGLTLAAVAILLFALSAFSPRVLGDGDTWSHLATGEWIIAHGAVPHADPFSHSMQGAPWTAHEWLSEIVLTLAFRCGGWSGVALLTGLAAASAALIMGLRVARDLGGAALAVTVTLGVGLLTPGLLARPHVLALPLLAGWSAGLLHARDQGRAPPPTLAALMIPWSNMHGGFIFGLALIGPFALEALDAAPREARLIALRDWALFGFTSLAAALVNPYGIEALLFPFRLMGVAGLSRISEWQPQDFSHIGPMEIALLLLLGFALIRPIRMPLIRAATLVGLVAMALQHSRHELLFGIIGPMLLAGPVAEAIGAARASEDWGRVARVALTASLAAALAIGALRLFTPIERVDGTAAPISALKAVPPQLRAQPALNEYGFGGYLIWSHVRPFIDGRADMFGGPMLSLYRELSAGDPKAVEETLKRYRIAWTIFAPDTRIVATLDREPGWRRLYSDAFAVVHVRDDATPRPDGLRGD